MVKKRGSAVTDALPWLILALVLLVILILFSTVLKEKGIEILSWIKNLFRRT